MVKVIMITCRSNRRCFQLHKFSE